MPARGGKAEMISDDNACPGAGPGSWKPWSQAKVAGGWSRDRALRRGKAPSESGSAAEIRKSEGSEPHPMASSFKRSSFEVSSRALPHSMVREQCYSQ